ncbi:MAG: hypothetical protein ACXWUG_23260 [Polyangiales bacterium]
MTCASAISANLVVGAMRIMADKHWATDTVVAGALGAMTGWLLPTLIYYRGGRSEISNDTVAKRSPPPVIPMPFVVNGGLGLSLTGIL